jgi:hypothetical protein
MIYMFVKEGVNVNALLDDSVTVEEFRQVWNYRKQSGMIDQLRKEVVDQKMVISALSKSKGATG